MVNFGLSELVVVLSIFSLAAIPGVIIYFDAKRKGRRKLFWSLLVTIGLAVGLIPGLIVILIYLLSSDSAVDVKKTDQNAGGDACGEKANISDSELERVFGMLNENERKIVEVLTIANGISQNEIAARTGLSTPTVSRILGKLESRGMVVRYREGMSKKVKLTADYSDYLRRKFKGAL